MHLLHGSPRRGGRHATGASPPAKKPKKSLTALQSAIEVAATEDRAGTFRVLGEAVAQLGEATVAAQKQAEDNYEETNKMLTDTTTQLKAERAKKKASPTPMEKLQGAVDAWNDAMNEDRYDDLGVLASAAKECAKTADLDEEFDLRKFAADRLAAQEAAK
jgi:hypothetical protein